MTSIKLQLLKVRCPHELIGHRLPNIPINTNCFPWNFDRQRAISITRLRKPLRGLADTPARAKEKKGATDNSCCTNNTDQGRALEWRDAQKHQGHRVTVHCGLTSIEI